MKKSIIAMLLVFGVSATGTVFACENNHDQAKTDKSASTAK